MAGVVFQHVAKVYPDGTRAVDDLSLAVRDGELVVIVGPSGSGKTTALRMVAGLEEISEGTISIGDRAVNHVPARDRDIAMVFQSYALYPHLSVFENIAFGLKVKKVPRPEIVRRVQHAAELLDLGDLLERKPRALSGGQRQRVAMGRAIVREPAVFLMDEPLSNLDAQLRVHTRPEVGRLQRQLGTTTIYVTHDQVEAMTMGDRVAVMRSGRLQQFATPQEVYNRPVNVFVGGFIGSPAMNLVDGTIQSSNGDISVLLGGQRLALDTSVLDNGRSSASTTAGHSLSASDLKPSMTLRSITRRKRTGCSMERSNCEKSLDPSSSCTSARRKCSSPTPRRSRSYRRTRAPCSRVASPTRFSSDDSGRTRAFEREDWWRRWSTHATSTSSTRRQDGGSMPTERAAGSDADELVVGNIAGRLQAKPSRAKTSSV